MNIAMDLTQIPADKTGIGIYAKNLAREIHELIRHDNESQKFNFYFFAQDDDQDWHFLKDETRNCCLIPIRSRIFRKLPFRFFFEQVLLPRECKQLKIDAIYSFHYTMPYLTCIPRIVTIPDMTFYLFPGLHRKIKRLYFKTLIPLSLKKSRKIITISESTKKDLLKRFPNVNPEKVTVIHLGTEVPPAPEVHPGPEVHPDSAEKGLPVQPNKHLEKFGLEEKKYFLYVGTLEPRKNIPAILTAFHRVIMSEPAEKNPFKLVIAGKKGWFYHDIFTAAKKLHLGERVIFPGYLEEEVKQSLLAHAFLFVYPSFYEGFGLPILEAMAYGVPVITGNLSSLPEVAGDAAILIDPHHWEEIAAAMDKLVSDQALWENLSKKGLAQAQFFSWQQTAQKTLALFHSLDKTNC